MVLSRILNFNSWISFAENLVIVLLMLIVTEEYLTLSWRRTLSYRNQSIDLVCIPMDWFLYDNDHRHERVKIMSNIHDEVFFQV